MAKPAIITISRQQVENDIETEMGKGKGKSRLEAAYCVMGHANRELVKANAQAQALFRKAKGDDLTKKQRDEYDRICRTIIEPETQRVGHCRNIIAKLTKSK